MRIIVDAFGGDNAPASAVKGAVLAADAGTVQVVLVGDEEKIRATAVEQNLALDKVEIVHAPDVMEMEDEPRRILKDKKNRSMAVGLQLVAEGKGDAFVSAGSTGALIMGATFIVKRIKGVARPALAPLLPSHEGPYMLVDSGANAECRPEMLLQFGVMGSLYMEHVLCKGEKPSVGLLNIGTEECKGGELQKSAFALLKDSDLHFIGNIEARDVPYGRAKVVVADGFTGNVLLKTIEGTAGMLMSSIKSLFMTNLLTKVAALMVKPHIAGLKKMMDTSEHGGAPVLGVNRPVIKAHGNSDARAIQSAIRVAAEFAEAGVIERIAEAVATKPAEE
ncbi:MAG: phosphate acyltransferase PlsX [Clostridia bacterium]|nr:phosphate acyltransferase PlsX [Clostridia bacterium]